MALTLATHVHGRTAKSPTGTETSLFASLREAWPEVFSAHRDATDDMTERLGDHHDLAVLRDTLLEEPAAFGAPADLEALVGLIERRQAALQAEAFALGRKVLAEKRSTLLRRWGAYWAVWESEKKAQENALAA